MTIMPISGSRIQTVPKNYSSFQKTNEHQYNTKLQQSFDSVSFSGRITPKPLTTLFDNYKPSLIHTGEDAYNVHNTEILKRMYRVYTSKEFKKLFSFAEQKGAFDLNINPKTHYIKTSLIDPKENPLMSKLVWITDSCRYMPILKDKHPEAVVPLINNMAHFYQKQERSFNRIINDPLMYELNRDMPDTAKNGIGHVFNPKNLTTHKWFAHSRLDSPGLYMQTMADTIIGGFNGAKYGFKKAENYSQESLDALSNITAYLKAIVYPYAKDTGAWEEKTFNITPSSDVAIVNEGFRKVIDLMYSKTKNPEILKIRQRLLNSKHGEVYKDENALKELLRIGEERIKTNSLEEVPGERALDGALGFVAHTEKFSDDAVQDAQEIIKRMEKLEPKFNIAKNDIEEKLVRENGTLRYIDDRYLNMTTGHKIDRTGKLPENTEAQWFMTSDISKSYGVAVKRLLDKFETEGVGRYYDDARNIMKEALQKETEYINRAYGRITGMNSFKANGKPCPPYQIPEAYQAVRKSDGEIIFVPGTHTPLGWAQASLYEASKLMLENLTRLEKLYI